MKEEPYSGRLAEYGGGGYVQLLPNTSDALLHVLVQLQKDEWIDQATRAVFVDFTTYNANDNVFAVARSLASLVAWADAYLRTKWHLDPFFLGGGSWVPIELNVAGSVPSFILISSTVHHVQRQRERLRCRQVAIASYSKGLRVPTEPQFSSDVAAVSGVWRTRDFIIFIFRGIYI